MRFQVAILAAVTATATALAVPHSYVVHEKRSTPRENARRLEPHARLPVRVGLKSNQQARQKAEQWLMDVSHPHSLNYGKHWSQEEVFHAFSPSNDTVSAVSEWLVESGGISRERISLKNGNAWIAFDATVEEVERLLLAEYYELDDGEKKTVSCDQYHLPSHLQEHVDYVTPGVKGVQFKAKRYVKV